MCLSKQGLVYSHIRGITQVSLLWDTPKTPDWRDERTAAMAANRNRNRKISIWLSEAELALFDKKCGELGISKSEFIRNCILYGSTVKKTLFSDERADRIIYEMNRIGNNINQIARFVNKEHSVGSDDYERIRNLVNALNDLLMDKVLG